MIQRNQFKKIKNLKKDLKKKLKDNKTTVIGVGNSLRGDDAIGPKTANKLKKELKNISVLNTGRNPENYLLEIKEMAPETIVFINATKNEKKPGSLTLKELPEEKTNQFLTHQVTLNSLSKILTQLLSEKNIDPNFYLVGVEIADTLEMTELVEERINELYNVFCDLDKVVNPLKMEKNRSIKGV